MRSALILLVSVLAWACSCPSDAVRAGRVEVNVAEPVDWTVSSESESMFRHALSRVDPATGTLWFCVSRGRGVNQSPSFSEADCQVDLRSGAFGGWASRSDGSSLLAVLPIQESVNSLRLLLWRDGSVRSLGSNCLSFPTDVSIAGPFEQPVVSLGFGCRTDCSDGAFLADSEGRTSCARGVGRVEAVSKQEPIFLEFAVRAGSKLQLRTWSLDPASPAPAVMRDSLVLDDEPSLTKVGRYGDEARYYAYSDSDSRLFRDDIVIGSDGRLSRVATRLGQVSERVRLLESTTSFDGRSTFFLIQSNQGVGPRLEILRVDRENDTLVWRKPLTVDAVRLRERVAANSRGVGYWAVLEGSVPGRVDIWYEFLAN